MGLPRRFEIHADASGVAVIFPRMVRPPRRSERVGGQVTETLTVITPAEALGYLQAVAPSSLTPEGLRLIAAQSAVETAHWKAMHNWNFGNVTPYSDSEDWITQGVRNMRYDAFPNGLKGAKAMMDWLSRHGALDPASRGDYAGYMQALQNGCYLGCIGNTDPSDGHTIGQSDYDTYGANLGAIAESLRGVTPVPPGFFSAHPTLKMGLKILGGVAAALGAAVGGGYVASRV